MADPPKAGAAIDGRAVVVAVAELGLAGVDADADLDRTGRRPGSAAKVRWMVERGRYGIWREQTRRSGCRLRRAGGCGCRRAAGRPARTGS